MLAPLCNRRRASDEKRLACPYLDPSSLTGPVRSLDRQLLEGIAARYGASPSFFGLELKLAYLLEASGHVEERLRRPYYRLAQEPIIWSWWDSLQQCPLAPADMLALASLLNGKPVAWRVREMVSLAGAGGKDLLYERPDASRTWLADIAAADAGAGDPVKKALYRFARIILAHPFTDANGRFARAALQAGLARGGLIATPCLALAPVFYLRAAEIRTALGDLSRAGDWGPYFERMGAVLTSGLTWLDGAGGNSVLRQRKYRTEIPV